MGRANQPHDVWKYIDMAGGDTEKCWMWKQAPGGLRTKMKNGEVSASSKARGYFSLGGRKRTATHVVYEQFYGVPVGPDNVIRHKCDTSLCMNPHHMILGTHAENMNDMVERDRHGLPHHVVRRIRVLLDRGGRTHQEIGDMYAVSRTVVTRIANDQAHTHELDYPKGEDEEHLT